MTDDTRRTAAARLGDAMTFWRTVQATRALDAEWKAMQRRQR